MSIWHWRKVGRGVCIACVNTILSLIAAALAIIIFANKVPIPDFVLKQYVNQLSEYGLDVSWNAFTSNLAGEITIRELRFRDRVSGDEILYCEQLSLDLDYGQRLLGKPVTIESLQIFGAAAYMPPEISQGQTEPVIFFEEIALRKIASDIEILRAQAEVGNARFRFRGQIPVTGSSNKSQSIDLNQIRSNWIRSIIQLQRARVITQIAPEATFACQFKGNRNNDLLASFTFTSPSAAYGSNIHLKDLLLQTANINLSQKRFEGETNGWLESWSVETPSTSLTGSNTFFSLVSDDPGLVRKSWRLPSRLKLNFGELRGLPVPVESSRIELDVRDLPDNIRGEIRSNVGGLQTGLVFEGNPASQSGNVHFEITGSPMGILSAPELGLQEVAEQTRFSPNCELTGNVYFEPGLRFDHLRMKARLRDFSVREAHFDQVYLDAWADNRMLIVGPIDAFDPQSQYATGYYCHDFTSKNYRILARGAVFPRRLDSLLAGFYRNLWNWLDPGPLPVSADVDVCSNWGHPRMTQARVAIDGNELGYNGVPVEHAIADIEQATGFVKISDLFVQTGSKTMNGSVSMVYPYDQQDPKRTVVDLESDYTLSELAKVFGDEISTIADSIQSDENPHISLKGAVDTFPEGNTTRKIEIEGAYAGNLNAFGLDLEGLELKGNLIDQTFHFDPIQFGFHGGNVTAAGILDFTDETNRSIQLKTTAESCRYVDSVNAVVSLIDAERDPIVPPESGQGTITLSLDINGNPDQWDSYSGTGQATILGAPLGRIDLFGGLTRIFSSIGINIAQFQLSDLASDLKFTPGAIGFPNLKLSGSSVQIESEGTITLPEGGLDFDARLFLKESATPSLQGLLGGILRPLGHALEIEIEGTISKPQWSFKRNPLNLLSPRNRSEESPDGKPRNDSTPDGMNP